MRLLRDGLLTWGLLPPNPRDFSPSGQNGWGSEAALAASGKPEAAKDAYRRFLNYWKDADADLSILAAAKQRVGALEAQASL